MAEEPVVAEGEGLPEEMNESDMKDLVVKDDIDEPVADEVAESMDTKEKEEPATQAADHNMDNEDSLNLTIGEDEANLLQEVSVKLILPYKVSSNL